MKILAVDSSSVAAAACIWEDNFLVGEYFLNTKLTHSQTIMEMVNSLTKESGIDIGEIDVFASAVGPGSFTGLRIGISAVKGMAYGAGKPCAAVSTLEGLANNLEGFEGVICPVMDARCNQVYTGLFQYEKGVMSRLEEDCAISIDELYERLENYSDRTIYLVGDGANLCMEKLSDRLDNLIVCPNALMYSRASSIAKVTEKKAKEGELVSSEELVPTYIRLPQAERELKKKQGNQ